MREINIWEPFLVKSQIIKTAIENCCMLLRIDDVVSGIKKGQSGRSTNHEGDMGDGETFGDARDG